MHARNQANKVLVTLLVTASLSLQGANATASFMGEEASGSPLVSGLDSGHGWAMCSIGAVSEHILVTAMHCGISEGSSISLPGQDVRNGSNEVLATFGPSSFTDGRFDDIEFIVVKNPIEGLPEITIASDSDISRFISNKSSGWLYGYGQTSLNTPSSTPNRVGLFANNISEGNLHLVLSNNEAGQLGSETCSGDSGGPVYIHDGGKLYLVGPQIARGTTGSITPSGCGGQTNEDAGQTAVAAMAYKYVEFLDMAKAFVESYHAVEEQEDVVDEPVVHEPAVTSPALPDQPEAGEEATSEIIDDLESFSSSEVVFDTESAVGMPPMCYYLDGDFLIIAP